MNKVQDDEADSVIRGEFFSDGATFVLKLADTPLSGAGASPDKAYENLLKATADAGDLTVRLKRLARDQQDERTRQTLIRSLMTSLVVLGVIGGGIIVSAGFLPKIFAEAHLGPADQLTRMLDNLDPDRERKLAGVLTRLDALVARPAAACPPAARAADAK